MAFDLLKVAFQYLVPQHGLTTLAGCLGDVKKDTIKNYIIQRFIHQYKINMKEALIEDPKAYACFNDFFVRYLKPGCRPLAEADVLSPVDGFVSEIGPLKEGQLLQAKGHFYSVADLLACNQEVASQFSNGCFATLYLSPKDYHRVHMPINAQLESMTYIPGSLFSVQPATVRAIPNLFARNERLAVFFSTPVGPMAMVMVGAIIVGAIGTRWHGDLKRSKTRVDFDYRQTDMKKIMAQGEEMGYFKLGSTVVLLFANGNQVTWSPSLKADSSIRFGSALGTINR